MYSEPYKPNYIRVERESYTVHSSRKILGGWTHWLKLSSEASNSVVGHYLKSYKTFGMFPKILKSMHILKIREFSILP